MASLPTLSQLRQHALAEALAIQEANNAARFKDAEAHQAAWPHGTLEAEAPLAVVVSRRHPASPVKRLDILAYSLASHPMDVWRNLGRDVNVRILLPDPTSESFVRRCLAAGVDPEHLVDWLTGYLPKYGAGWQVRLFACPLDFGVTVVDDTLFARPYSAAKSGHFSPTVVLHADNDAPPASLFKQHFERVWDSGRPVSFPYTAGDLAHESLHRLAVLFARDARLRDDFVSARAADLTGRLPATAAREVSALLDIVSGTATDMTPLPTKETCRLVLDHLMPDENTKTH